MAQLFVDPPDRAALAAAMARHPAGGGRPGAALRGNRPPSLPPRPSFAEVAALLTGSWRVDDPEAFAAAMMSAPIVAGYPVVDLAASVAFPVALLDPYSAATARRLESEVAVAAERGSLEVHWVSGRLDGRLYVEVRATAPAGVDGPELLLLAHLVEETGDERRPRRAPPGEEKSWVAFVVGDSRGGVAGIGRVLFGGRGWLQHPRGLGLDALRARLVAPALAAEGLPGAGAGSSTGAVVVPLRGRAETEAPQREKPDGCASRMGGTDSPRLCSTGGASHRIASNHHTEGCSMSSANAAVMDLADLAGSAGKHLGSSDWELVDQERINRFADATGDHQWIHLDAARAKTGPFGTTIAHGYLTLSLAPILLSQLLRVEGTSLVVNYGLNRVRFPSPVPSGSRVRLSGEISGAEPFKGGVQVTFTGTFEIEGKDKPACVAEIVFRYYE